MDGTSRPMDRRRIDPSAIESMSVAELKSIVTSHGKSLEGLLEKADLRAVVRQIAQEQQQSLMRGDVVAQSEANTSAGVGDGEDVMLTPELRLSRSLEQTASQHVAGILNDTLLKLSNGIHLSDLPPVATKVCGKVFQDGDLAYNCRTCESDGTCVLCQECFNDSNHEGHEVLFHKAGLGGCCDCGDLEAWAEDGCCSRHGPNAHVDEDPSSTLPETMLYAGRTVFAGCIDFLSRLVEKEAISFHQALASQNFPTGSTPTPPHFHILIHNDDVHTFNDVTQVLTRQLHVANADEATNAIDKYGRCSVTAASSMLDAQNTVKTIRGSGLLISIAPTTLLGQEKAAVAMVAWLKAVCESSPAMARVLYEELAKVDRRRTRRLVQVWLIETYRWEHDFEDWGDSSMLDTLIKIHPFLPKLLTKQLADLFMRMIVDDKFRCELGLAMGHSLPTIARAYAHGLGTNADSLIHLGVQVFTVKSVAMAYQEKYGMSMLLRTLQACVKFLRVTCDPETNLTDLNHPGIVHRRYRMFFQNVRYQVQLNLLDRMDPDALVYLFEYWMVDLLQRVNFLDEHKKHQGSHHVEYERELWANAFNLSSDVATMTEAATTALKKVQSATHKDAVTTILQAACRRASIDPDYVHLIALGTLPVSFHLPVHRFAALLCRKLVACEFWEGDRAEEMLSYLVESPTNFIDRTSRIISANSQIATGLWRRDGAVLFHEMSFYVSDGRKYFYDLDLFSLQMAVAADATPDLILKTISQRYGVYSWLRNNQLIPTESDGLDSTLPMLISLSEELLELFAKIRSSMQFTANDPAVLKAALRRAVVHSLATAPVGGIPFSEILLDMDVERLLDEDDEDGDNESALTTDDVAKILNQCARSIESSGGERKFELKAALWISDFDPFYWRLQASEKEHATELREKQIASESPTKPVPFAPKPLPVARELAKAARVFHSSFFLNGIIRPVLCDAVYANRKLMPYGVKYLSNTIEGNDLTLRTRNWSEEDMYLHAKRTSSNLVHAALYLLTTAMHNPEFIHPHDLVDNKDNDFHQFSVLECLVALRSQANVREAEGSGLEWLLSVIKERLSPQSLQLQFFFQSLSMEQQQQPSLSGAGGITSSSSKVAINDGKKKESRKRKAVGAQQAMLDKMREAQQAAVKNLFPDAGDSEGAKEDTTTTTLTASASMDVISTPGFPLDDTRTMRSQQAIFAAAVAGEDVEKDEPLVCSLCGETGDKKDLGFFSFSHASTWERRNGCVQPPRILSDAADPPLGWTRPIDPTAAAAVVPTIATNSPLMIPLLGLALPPQLVQLQQQQQHQQEQPAATAAGVTLDLDWGMMDVPGLAQLGGQTTVLDEDDDDDDEDEEDGEEDGLESGMEEEEEDYDEMPYIIDDDDEFVPASGHEFEEEDDDDDEEGEGLAAVDDEMASDGEHQQQSGSEEDYVGMPALVHPVSNNNGPLITARQPMSAVPNNIAADENDFIDTMLVETVHGMQPPRIHVRCCPHVIHLKCLQVYQSSANVERTELTRFHEFQCPVCKTVSNSLMLAGDVGSATQSNPNALDDSGWKDISNFRINSNDCFDYEWLDVYLKIMEQTIPMQCRDTWQSTSTKGLSALGSVACTFSIRVDTMVRSRASMDDILQDAIKTRKQSLAIFQTMARGGLHVLVSENAKENCVEDLNRFVHEGFSSTSIIGFWLTSSSQNVLHSPKPSSIVRVPLPQTPLAKCLGPVLYCSSDICKDVKFRQDPIDLTVVVFQARRGLLVKPGFVLTQIDGENVDGKLFSELKLTGNHAYKFVFFPDNTRARRTGANLLDVDPFELFCILIQMSWKALSESRLRQILKLCLAVCLVRSMLLERKKFGDDDADAVMMEASGSEDERVFGTMKRMMMIVSADSSTLAHGSERVMVEEATALMVQISACFAIFLGPGWVNRVSALGLGSISSAESSASEFVKLWSLFELEPLDDVVAMSSFKETVSLWVSAWNSQQHQVNSPAAGFYRSLKTCELSARFVHLPQRYDELYSLVMTQGVCPTRKVSPPKEAALCLLCGEVVCAGASCCKRKDFSIASPGNTLMLSGDWLGVGAVTMHAHAAGDGLAVFLFVQRCQILLVNKGRAHFIPAPYVDQHGDADPNLVRGRPLFLHKERYEVLQKLVADHKLANEVARLRSSASQILYLDHF